MRGHGTKLPRKRQLAVASLIQCSTIKEAAEAVGIGEATLHRWLTNSEFQKEYRNAKKIIVDEAITNIQKASRESVTVLREIMLDLDKPPNVRVIAARAILDIAVKSIESENLMTRIDALEKRLNAHKS